MAQWVELLAVKPKSLSSTFWTHRVLKKVIVFIYVKKNQRMEKKESNPHRVTQMWSLLREDPHLGFTAPHRAST